jgi:type II secretory pathway pseudopilin PulG
VIRRAAAALLLGASACAAPARFQAVAADARAQEATSVLKQAFTLQEVYRADNDRYATTLAQLREAGWEDPPGLAQYHPPRIVRASADAMCVEMLPLRDDVWPQHVDQSGEVRRGPCP